MITKKRCWAFLVWDDSAPDDWREILKLNGLPCAISPHHCNDLEPDGSPKKPHYHVIIYYDGPTTFNNVKSLTDRLNTTIPIPLDSPRGMYNYHIHHDNPDKFQYPDEERTFINGFNLNDLITYTEKEKLNMRKTIQKIIIHENITEYSTLMDYLLAPDFSDLYWLACTQTLYFNSYITSRRHRIESEERVTSAKTFARLASDLKSDALV